MRYISYLTRASTESALTHGCLPEVERLAEKVERDQSINSWNNFLPTPYVKKSLGSSYRVIAAKTVLQDDIVISFLSVLPRGSRDYETFWRDPRSFDALLPSEREIEDLLEHRRPDTVPSLPVPDALELSYLYDRLPRLDTTDGIIYESKEWVERVLKSDTLLAWYFDLVYEIYEIASKENPHETIAKKHNIRILYRAFPEQKRIFLIAPIQENSSDDEALLRERYKRILNSNLIEDEDLLKLSGRAYPAFIIYGESIWMAMQTNAEANLALSPEEADILNSVAHPEQKSEKVYPLFINGRPGTGKSTILQYLFAEHLYLHLSKKSEDRLQYPPLYLTYSEKLLQWAKALVQGLVLCNPKMKAQGHIIDPEELKEISSSCFGEFHKFLYNLLPLETRNSFDLSKRVDYPEFRRLWGAKMKGEKLSPELVWHVMRTYIKGMRDDSNNHLAPDDYESLPNKQKTVEQSTFERIYDRAWERWYKKLCDEQGFWDDQDLARALLSSSGLDLSNYPVVFCDEAQDFSKIELELILQLSLFSRRTVPPQDLRRIPFAFAGDPYQTLNPTGFDWSSVQSGFHEKIVQELDKTSRAKLEFNFQELSFNYRSTKNIVGFCNLIQILRGILFDIRDLKPQRPWFDQDSPMPVFFDVEDPTVQSILEDQSEIVIILPCQEGEEVTYIEGDAFLKRIAKEDVRNFLSPMSAKGLEFSRVVLYKFGHDYCEHYPTLLTPFNTGIPHSVHPEAALPLEYFMNRLYVAASRPKRRLFIVDTALGIEALWNSDRFRNPEDLLRRYPTASNYDWTPEDLSCLQPGVDASWSEDRDNPLTLAEQFREEGITKKDPYKLILAEANFKRAGRFKEARECRAQRFEIEELYDKAGMEYLGLGDSNNALRCFWVGKCYQEISEGTSFDNSIEQRAANFVVGQKSAASCEAFVGFLFDEMRGVQKARIIADKHWIQICELLISSLAGLTSPSID